MPAVSSLRGVMARPRAPAGSEYSLLVDLSQLQWLRRVDVAI